MAGVATDRPWSGIVADINSSTHAGNSPLCSSEINSPIPVCDRPADFTHQVARHFDDGQRNAIERLVRLKAVLREADPENFWNYLVEGLAAICNAQCAFVADNRKQYDVEMGDGDNPSRSPHGIVLYYDNGYSIKGFLRNHNNLASYIPCASMGHDKAVLIPENLDGHMGENASLLPFPLAAYLAVPLPTTDKLRAHLGLMWTAEGLKKRDVSWAYLEMIMHSLEDLILQRIATEPNRAKSPQYHQIPDDSPRQLRPSFRKTVATPNYIGDSVFKPFARCLSHELRTPMQGVVGMLDVIHATVQETIQNQPDTKTLSTFEELRENIEAVQDSSRRAVEAADNIVHAYDLNMEVPDTPHNSIIDGAGAVTPRGNTPEPRPNILIEGSDIPVNPHKRRRSAPSNWSRASSPKRAVKSPKREVSPRTAGVKSAVEESDKIVHATTDQEMQDVFIGAVSQVPSIAQNGSVVQYPQPEPVFPPMVLPSTKIRDILHLVIKESLHVGGRPDTTEVYPTATGENIEINSVTWSGESSKIAIEWSVEPSVPETLFFDEKDFAKLISCVFLNALKFTESGNITVKTTLNSGARYVRINIKDTGAGIPEEFFPKLYTAFARGDDSITRSKEGLGLGLLVAKGLSRKLRGDLTCIHTSTTGPDRGSEFEVKLPIGVNETVSSRPGTPQAEPQNPYHSITLPNLALTAHSELGSSSSSKLRSEVPRNGERPSPPTSPMQQDCDELTTSICRRLSQGLRGVRRFDSKLAEKYPLTFLVAEDNKINRKILINMLSKLGYKDIYEAFDGNEAVRIMGEVLYGKQNDNPTLENQSFAPQNGITNPQYPDSGIQSPPPSAVETDNHNFQTTCFPTNSEPNRQRKTIDVVLMDLWMPGMDGYEATERILGMADEYRQRTPHMPSIPNPTVLAVSADVTDEALTRATTVGMEGYMTKPYKLSDLERLIIEFCGCKQSR